MGPHNQCKTWKNDGLPRLNYDKEEMLAKTCRRKDVCYGCLSRLLIMRFRI